MQEASTAQPSSSSGTLRWRFSGDGHRQETAIGLKGATHDLKLSHESKRPIFPTPFARVYAGYVQKVEGKKQIICRLDTMRRDCGGN